MIRGRRVYFYQDNSSAFSAAITGVCLNEAVRDVSAMYHLVATALNVSIWTEHVDTNAMIADIPSRQNGDGHKHEAKFKDMSPTRVPLVLPTTTQWGSRIEFFDSLRALN